ncbi:MAG TPA: hypothetical protein VH496_16340 [Mycobacterium sp.]|jgi:hypothetical protein
MNRDQRRRLPKEVQAVLDHAHCPDCDSEAEITEPTPGFHYLQIRHDDTCPWFTAYQKEQHA